MSKYLPMIGILDYGASNILNVINACECLDMKVKVVTNHNDIKRVTHLILPGVGAFSSGIKSLNEKKLVEPIINHIRLDKPFLGICLGMQMMLERSYEFGIFDGLGIIKGNIIKLPNTSLSGIKHKIPHIGWNKLIHKTNNNFKTNKSVYFVHSFIAECKSNENVISFCRYNDILIPAIIKKNNSYGFQFHPEKSGQTGLSLLEEFAKL